MISVKRALLRVRGIDPEEIEQLIGASGEERKRLRRERKQAEDEAYRRYVNLRMRRS